MKISKVREIAARILKGAEGKIWIDPSQAESAREAMTSEDVRGLIKEKVIVLKKPSHQSRARARMLEKRKKRGRKSGIGKRRAKWKVRSGERSKWMKKIRALRKKLGKMKSEGKAKGNYRKLYNRAKGGYFRGKKHLSQFSEGTEASAREKAK